MSPRREFLAFYLLDCRWWRWDEDQQLLHNISHVSCIGDCLPGIPPVLVLSSSLPPLCVFWWRRRPCCWLLFYLCPEAALQRNTNTETHWAQSLQHTNTGHVFFRTYYIPYRCSYHLLLQVNFISLWCSLIFTHIHWHSGGLAFHSHLTWTAAASDRGVYNIK